MFHVEKTTQEIMYPGYVMGEDQFDEGTSQNVTVFKMILNLSSATNKQDKQHLEEAIKTGKLELLIWKDKELVVKTFILNDSNSSEKAEYNFSINGGRSYKGNIYFFYMYNGAQVAQPIMNYN
ncbi:MAG: hypothetical protein KZQ73_10435 [Candidatus Thiodiazotropha sp. (ex Semelilucina semeliformis)]|nr:hypothetical protein [Candidatus Thiodiazotropha sp. (ex Semelilucina semeliformis)]